MTILLTTELRTPKRCKNTPAAVKNAMMLNYKYVNLTLLINLYKIQRVRKRE
ncbi:hypothetical protein EV102420_07_03270 [Pseudescherichia vulneris NBRC 102420]|uniref:Uncharacterized protein n=1 Tax=Pseudescherichia vulneris NBRC 102420 TaxID=1115515 RepID=A0A090UY25_PSEVU|nr:hypothetical protein EV102420_07_03270 [Pseudescherichia vulneris NBRC 102420]